MGEGDLMATLDGSNLTTRGGAGGLQLENFIVSNPSATYSLAGVPAQDADGDSILSVKINGLEAKKSVDYTLSLNVISWTSSQFNLETGDRLEVFYQPI